MGAHARGWRPTCLAWTHARLLCACAHVPPHAPARPHSAYPPAQVLNELEALEVQDEAGWCRTYLDAPLRLLVAAASLTLKLVALGKHLSLAARGQRVPATHTQAPHELNNSSITTPPDCGRGWVRGTAGCPPSNSDPGAPSLHGCLENICKQPRCMALPHCHTQPDRCCRPAPELLEAACE